MKEYYFYHGTPTHSYMKYLYKDPQAAPEDVLICLSIYNRGLEAALLHLLPTLWFRNTWPWPDGGSKLVLQSVEGAGHRVIHAPHTNSLSTRRRCSP
jgi:hypothetical protein